MDSRVREPLSSWEKLLPADEGVDPLVRMAVAHYQIEAILSFSDGNGHTGRILNSLFPVEQGLLTLPVLHLSRHIIRNEDDGYRLLPAVPSHRAWEAWLLCMLRCVGSRRPLSRVIVRRTPARGKPPVGRARRSASVGWGIEATTSRCPDQPLSTRGADPVTRSGREMDGTVGTRRTPPPPGARRQERHRVRPPSRPDLPAVPAPPMAPPGRPPPCDAIPAASRQ